MPIVVEVKHPDLREKLVRQADALRVIGRFRSLPAGLRLLVFFDDTDAEFFREKLGEQNRGFFKPLKGVQTGAWPHYLRDHLLACGSFQSPATWLFDTVIYLHGTTCEDPVGRVMTFAHELQHFVQYGFSRGVWAASEVFRPHLPAFEIPIEREARIVAKCTAEDLCSPEAVKHYVAERINVAEKRIALLKADYQPNTDKIKNWKDEVDDWRFIQQLDAPAFYDLAARTKLAFDNFPERKAEFEKQLQGRENCDSPDPPHGPH